MTTSGEMLSTQLRRIRETVLARHGIAPGMPIPRGPATSTVEEAARLATVMAHWGIASDAPVVGRLLVVFRRALRLTLRWYINPIVEQQNAFNDAVVHALYELRIENEQLRAEVRRLQPPAASPAP